MINLTTYKIYIFLNQNFQKTISQHNFYIQPIIKLQSIPTKIKLLKINTSLRYYQPLPHNKRHKSPLYQYTDIHTYHKNTSTTLIKYKYIKNNPFPTSTRKYTYIYIHITTIIKATCLKYCQNNKIQSSIYPIIHTNHPKQPISPQSYHGHHKTISQSPL